MSLDNADVAPRDYFKIRAGEMPYFNRKTTKNLIRSRRILGHSQSDDTWILVKGDSSVCVVTTDEVQDNFLSALVCGETALKEHDKLLGGLLPPGLDESSCLSRYQWNLYRTLEPRQPSSHLISRLRNYEALHKRCGPNTDPFNKTMQLLISGTENTTYSACKYIIWTPLDGLGNRMLTLLTTFLYALLTNRVLLIGDGGNMPDLFCEPFPEESWLLPSDFPIGQFRNFNLFSHQRYGNLLKKDSLGKLSTLPPYVHIHLVHDYDDDDRHFFCDHDQTLLQNVPWLILKSNLYFVPSLFLIPSFQQELNNLFPEKETVFHHLGRYLFHPTNSVWGLITRYYETYLAKADEKLGIQIRVFSRRGKGPLKHVLEQILSCTMKENLLPEVNKTESIIEKAKKRKTKAVLITSLSPGYYDEIRNLYWQYGTNTGESIAIHQPSHEEVQHIGNQIHDQKALAEMYLLSLTNKLVTSARSTFGYIAYSLGGLHPWILHMPRYGKVPDPPCRRASSMEPCFHFPPAIYSCRNKNATDTSKIVPYVRHCEDVISGLKLFDD